MIKTNEEFINKYLSSLKDVSSNTAKDYTLKLNALKKQIRFDDEEAKLVEFLNTIENPNTRSNKTHIILRLRDHFNMPVGKLQALHESIKTEILQHRKQKAKQENESLISYDELQRELDTMHGAQYFMNYMYANHGVRNQDINVRFKKKAPEIITENLIVFGKAKNPRITVHIVDYKTASTYGPKKLVIKNQRLADELKSLDLKDGDYLFTTRDGKKATLNYMNVLSSRESIKGYGEGRIAKILLRHLIDTKQFDRIEQLSQQRGTAMSTLYTTYNLQDNK